MENLKQADEPNEKKITNMPEQDQQIDGMRGNSIPGNDDIKMEEDEEDNIEVEEGDLEDVEDGIEDSDEDDFESEENKPQKSEL